MGAALMLRRPPGAVAHPILWGAIALGGLVAPGATRAFAERPSFAPGTEPLVHDGAMGHVRVHYVATSGDAVPEDDADRDGLPDYVQDVAALAEIAWDDLVARGFRPPLADDGIVPGDVGGDARLDIYLRDLTAADGNFVIEACTTTPVHCAGFVAMDNDLAGFGYASSTEGISVLTSHELFHAVQNAYAPDQTLVWSEGTAVWNQEQTFPDQSDYERLVAHFLARPQRPFDRPGGGFGDLYAYGSALWPTFLDERYGDGLVRRVWEASEEAGPGADFLAVTDLVLGQDGESLASAWTEFSRWNLFSASRADPERAYQGGADLDPVALEEAVTEPGAVETSLEGMSARYLPVAVTADDGTTLEIDIEVDDDAVAAFFPRDVAGSIGAEIELTRRDGRLTAALPDPGTGFLVLTSLRRGGLPRDATVTIAAAPPHDPEGGGDDGGCHAASDGSSGIGAVVTLLLAASTLRPGRRRPGSPKAPRPPAPGPTARQVRRSFW